MENLINTAEDNNLTLAKEILVALADTFEDLNSGASVKTTEVREYLDEFFSDVDIAEGQQAKVQYFLMCVLISYAFLRQYPDEESANQMELDETDEVFEEEAKNIYETVRGRGYRELETFMYDLFQNPEKSTSKEGIQEIMRNTIQSRWKRAVVPIALGAGDNLYSELHGE